MANHHEVELSLAQSIPIGNVDAALSVKKGGRTLGKLQMSRGNVNWVPSGSQSKYVLDWKTLGDLFKQHGVREPK
jgi:hypothetical protein